MSALTLKDYKEKAIVVEGDTQSYKTTLKDNKGMWNGNLEGGRKGWIFPKTRKDEIQKLVDKINKGDVAKEVVEGKEKSKEQAEKSYVDRVDFLALVSRIEYLEAQVAQLKQGKLEKVPMVEQDNDVDDLVETQVKFSRFGLKNKK